MVHAIVGERSQRARKRLGAASQESAPDPSRTAIPWEIFERWLEKKDQMRERGRASGHIIVITDDDC